MRGGKIIEEKPAIAINELVSDDEVPEEIKKTYSGNDLLLYKSLLKKSKDLINIKFWGCIGTGFILLGCVLAGIAVFIQN